MDPRIDSVLQGFESIYLRGVPILLRSNDTAFLAFVCMLAAIDALAAYRYNASGIGERFTRFIREYYPAAYLTHADTLWVLRCRMLHNFSPAHFSLCHARPEKHLQPSARDTFLSDECFFADMHSAARRYFEELQSSLALQTAMLKRLNNLEAGGQIHADW